MSFRETDTAGACATAAFCSGLAAATTVAASRRAIFGGTAGAASESITLAKGNTTNVFVAQFEINPAGLIIAPGVWTVRVNTTTAFSQALTIISQISICLVSSGCANKITIASDATLAESVTVTGVQPTLLDGIGVVPAAGDLIEIVIGMRNGSTTKTSTGSITPTELIDTPMYAAPGGDWDNPVLAVLYSQDPLTYSGRV